MTEQKESSVCEECQKKTEHKFMEGMSASKLDAKERIENIYANASCHTASNAHTDCVNELIQSFGSPNKKS